jgi:hypothetical protein
MRTAHLRKHPLWLSAAVAGLAWACISCSGTAEGLTAVSGRVLCDGQPAAGALLYFHRQAGGEQAPANVSAIIPSAVVSEDGTFTVKSPPVGYGAAPGKYVILAQWPEDIDPTPAQTNPKTVLAKGKKVTVAKRNTVDLVPVDRLKGHYMDKSKALLQPVEVKAGSNDLGTIELKLHHEPEKQAVPRRPVD